MKIEPNDMKEVTVREFLDLIIRHDFMEEKNE